MPLIISPLILVLIILNRCRCSGELKPISELSDGTSSTWGSDFRTGDDVGGVSDHHGGDCHNDQSLFRIAPSKGRG